ncbi:MAG: AEC family transporter [Actinomycetota bacterium]
MLEAAGSLVAIAVLVMAGLVMARRGWLGGHAVDGLKVLITNVTLPLLLFRAFLQLEPDGRNAVLSFAVFASCAVMGGIGAMLTRALRLPAPETRLLFQGFEAGMLGYAFFVALHGADRLSAFAALDLGQVVYVFTALLIQMSILEQARVRDLARASLGGAGGVAGVSAGGGGSPDGGHAASSITFPWRDVAASKVLWAIFGGLAISLVAPGFATGLAGPEGFAAAIFDTVGGLTTPLVCLVIGASLAAGVPRDPAIAKVVGLRTAVGLGLGLVFALLVVPALGFSEWHSRAAIMLFVLPAPFVIPVYHKGNPAFVSSVLTLSTLVSIVLIALLAVVGLA